MHLDGCEHCFPKRESNTEQKYSHASQEDVLSSCGFPGPIAIYLTTVTEILADDSPDAGHGRFKIGKPGNRQGQCVNDSQHISQHRKLRKLL